MNCAYSSTTHSKTACLTHVLFSPEKQKNTAGTWLSRATPCLKQVTFGLHLEAGGSLGRSPNPPQTKRGGSIPRYIAQFVGIMCQVMYGLCLHLFQTCNPSRQLHYIHCVYIYCSVFNTKLCILMKFVLLQVKNKPNHQLKCFIVRSAEKFIDMMGEKLLAKDGAGLMYSQDLQLASKALNMQPKQAAYYIHCTVVGKVTVTPLQSYITSYFLQ